MTHRQRKEKPDYFAKMVENPSFPLAVAVGGATVIGYLASREAKSSVKAGLERLKGAVEEGFRDSGTHYAHLAESFTPPSPPEPVQPLPSLPLVVAEPVPPAPADTTPAGFDPRRYSREDLIAIASQTGIPVQSFGSGRWRSIAQTQYDNYAPVVDAPDLSEEARRSLRNQVTALSVLLDLPGAPPASPQTLYPDRERIDTRSFLPYAEPSAVAPAIPTTPSPTTPSPTTPTPGGTKPKKTIDTLEEIYRRIEPIKVPFEPIVIPGAPEVNVDIGRTAIDGLRAYARFTVRLLDEVAETAVVRIPDAVFSQISGAANEFISLSNADPTNFELLKRRLRAMHEINRALWALDYNKAQRISQESVAAGIWRGSGVEAATGQLQGSIAQRYIIPWLAKWFR